MLDETMGFVTCKTFTHVRSEIWDGNEEERIFGLVL
jgi:hypothetical protein